MQRLNLKHCGQIVLLLGIIIGVAGCKGDGAEPAVSDSASNQKSLVSDISLSGNTLTISGSNLEKITAMKLLSASGDIQLEIQNKTNKVIQARPLSALSLVAGLVYNLAISTAQAADPQVVPVTISVTLPNLNCSASSAATFAGYTNLTAANINGLRGGNELCDTAYPGSHWANLEEIMKLGSAYPWAQAVWLRDFSADQVGNSGNYVCYGYKYSGTSLNAPCSTNPESGNLSNESGAPSLSVDGTQRYSCCNSMRALACIK